MGSARQEEHVRDDVVVVCTDGTPFVIPQGESISKAGKDLLVAAGHDDGFDYSDNKREPGHRQLYGTSGNYALQLDGVITVTDLHF